MKNQKQFSFEIRFRFTGPAVSRLIHWIEFMVTLAALSVHIYSLYQKGS